MTTNARKALLLNSRKRPYTILEIMVVIACIALIAGFFTINIRKAVLEQNFEAETSELLSQVKLAQDLNTLFGIDIEMKLREENGKTRSKMIPTGVVTQSFEELLRQNERVYDFTVSWQGTNFTNTNEVSLNFYDQGYHFPLGILKISGIKNLYLSLPGYAAPIHFTAEEGSLAQIEQKNRAAYDQLTPYVMQDPNVH